MPEVGDRKRRLLALLAWGLILLAAFQKSERPQMASVKPPPAPSAR